MKLFGHVYRRRHSPHDRRLFDWNGHTGQTGVQLCEYNSVFPLVQAQTKADTTVQTQTDKVWPKPLLSVMRRLLFISCTCHSGHRPVNFPHNVHRYLFACPIDLGAPNQVKGWALTDVATLRPVLKWQRALKEWTSCVSRSSSTFFLLVSLSLSLSLALSFLFARYPSPVRSCCPVFLEFDSHFYSFDVCCCFPLHPFPCRVVALLLTLAQSRQPSQENKFTCIQEHCHTHFDRSIDLPHFSNFFHIVSHPHYPTHTPTHYKY